MTHARPALVQAAAHAAARSAAGVPSTSISRMARSIAWISGSASSRQYASSRLAKAPYAACWRSFAAAYSSGLTPESNAK